MTNSQLLKNWFEHSKLPIGFNFGSLNKLKDGLDHLDSLARRGAIRDDCLLQTKQAYLYKNGIRLYTQSGQLQ